MNILKTTTCLSTVDEISFIIKTNDAFVSRSVQVYGEWSFGEIELFSQLLKKNSNVIEVGGNIGAHSVFIAKSICPEGKLFVFEPRRSLFHILCGNLALNEIYNTHAFQIALGDHIDFQTEGKMNFTQPLNAGGFQLGAIPGNDEEINVAPLDDFLDIRDRISLIKADVEGDELKVLIGAERLIEKDRPFLYLENDKIQNSPELISYIWDLKYEIWWHIVPLYRTNNRAGETKNIFKDIASFNILCVPKENNIKIKNGLKVHNRNEHPLKEAALPQ